MAHLQFYRVTLNEDFRTTSMSFNRGSDGDMVLHYRTNLFRAHCMFISKCEGQNFTKCTKYYCQEYLSFLILSLYKMGIMTKTLLKLWQNIVH